MSVNWTKRSWKKYPIRQQPEWPNKERLKETVNKLSELPSLVFSGETRKLRQALSGVNKGKNFVLQIGNCAESFTDCHGPKIHNFLRIFLQMSMVLEFKLNKKVIKIGRIAGQYAKPRSTEYELINGKEITNYRGDNVNDFISTPEARIPNPERLLEGYFRSASTLNLIRAFIQGGYNDIKNIKDWEEHFFSKEISRINDYKEFAYDITNLLENATKKPFFNKSNDQIFISHEGLILDYEEAFTRLDTTFGSYYDTSAHFIWIGERTRQLDGAHIEFICGIGNPVGIKIGPDYDLDEILNVIRKINPENEDGRLVLISRMGYNKVLAKLRPLLRAVKENKLNVVWICDPMHGNTYKHNGYKVRSFDHIVDEITSFFDLCRKEDIIPGGVHLEITDEYVTECVGGITGLSLTDLSDNYVTKVDPRLNAAQALEIAFIVSELLNTSS